MEVAGIGLSKIQMIANLNSKTINTDKSFNQFITAAIGNNPLLPGIINGQLNNQIQSDATGLLSFLKLTDLQKLTGGNELLQQLLQNPKANLLQMVKDFLGISDQKWTEMLANFGVSANDKVGDEQDILEAVLAGLSGLSANQLLPALNQNAQLVLKAAKLYDLLSAAKKIMPEQQNLTAFLEKVANVIQGFSQVSERTERQQYLEQTFSKTTSEINKPNGNASDTAHVDRSPSIKQVEWNGSPLGTHLWTRQEQIAMLADPNKKPVTAGDLQQQFQEILAKSQFSKTGGLQKLFIKLNPEQLGSLRIELTQKDQTIVAKILTSTSMAKEALESNLNSLKHAFAAQNIQVDRIEIGQQASLPERFLRDDRQNGENQPQQERQEQQQAENDEESADGFTLSLQSALLNMEV
ncbi:flagellar hook-length control protein FliK [Bacillota bacterium Lsc_1132]